MVRRLLATVLAVAIATGISFAAQGANSQGSPRNSSSHANAPQSFTVLADFAGSTNGAESYYGYLTEGNDGNVYGTTYEGGTYDEGTVFKVTPGGTLTELYSFCSQLNCADGSEPTGGLLLASNGNFYGTTQNGGNKGFWGTVFEITPAGQLTILYSFCTQTNCADGGIPSSPLIQASNGNFYGTTLSGGANDFGTVFEITPAGELTTLYSFCSQIDCADGSAAWSGLIQGANGNFYGTTYKGGTNGEGTVYEISPAGQLTTLYNFCSQPGCTDGANPIAGLVQVGGNLYGTTVNGGAYGGGAVFEITAASQFTTIYNFCSLSNCTDGLHPYAGLLLGSDGNLYGTTAGLNGPNRVFTFGTVFGMTTAGQLTTLHSFGVSDGAYPQVGLVEGSSGILYGATYFGGSQYDGTIFSLPLGLSPAPQERQPNTPKAQSNVGFDVSNSKAAVLNTPNHLAIRGSVVPGAGAKGAASLRPNTAKGIASSAAVHDPGSQALSNILNFDGANGAFPYYGSLAQGTDGNLYGTTWSGGPPEQGTVFKVTTAGTLTTLYSFCSQTNCPDGAEPFAGLIQASNGNFYGTTSQGGANGGGGTIFEVAGGQLTTLYNFCSQPGCADGNYSLAPVVQASNGNLYGTTGAGGSNGLGNIFEITLAGQLTNLYSFCSQPGCADGSSPYAGLVQGSNGNLYGTTEVGGVTDFCTGCGTIFEITPAGQITTLYSFCSQANCADGVNPYAGLVQGTDGNFYGTTEGGGLTDFCGGCGTIFEITPTGQLTTLYSFCSQTSCADGAYPYAGLVQVGGNFYGTTVGGGSDYGTVFEITSAGQLTILYTFSLIDGGLPLGALAQASNGNLYGLSLSGGNRLGGTVFSLPPVILLNPPTGTAQVGVAYSSSLVASGGVSPYTFSITIGNLPPGLSLNSSTGAITGTPNTAGTYNFTAQVTDSKGNTATAGCSIVVSAALTLNGPTGTAQVGVAYNSALNAAGGVPPYTFSIISGALPPELSLNPSTGAITGTPTTQGTYNFTAKVVDSQSNSATASCTIVVTTAGTEATSTSLTLTPSSVPVGSAGPVAMTATVTPTSGSGTPTGSVTYFNGSTQIGTTNLSSGVGTFNYNPSGLAVGIYSITAVYSGNATFSGSTSPAQTLAISQTGPFAYVADNGTNTVSVINIPNGQVSNNIVVGSGPWGTTISPDQTQVYVTNNEANNVSVINTASGSITATIPVQSSPFGVDFAPDGSSVYVVNGSSNTVSVINPATQTVVATIPVQNSPVAVAMAPTSNGTFAYVTNSASNTVSVINVGTNTVVQTVSVGTGPRWVTISPNSMWAYVENAGSNNVSVISVASNQVTATVPVGTTPFGAAVTPDNSTVYVANSGSNNVSVIDTQTNTVIDTVSGFNNPTQVAITTDGSSAYITNLNASTVSVIATASNTITNTVQVSNAPTGIAMASAPQTTLQITQPLSPTQPNTFNFGANSYAVQYPPGTQFTGVNMTVTSVEITQEQFQQRVAGTAFANASCIVYTGSAGNCVDDEVTCSDNNGNSITCPSEPQATIAVQTSLSTSQTIVNPGYLTTPIGENQWQNIFTGYSDPTVKGKTQGFSEFVAVDLGATNPQGAAHFEMLTPRLPKKYQHGEVFPIEFRLTSVANGKPVTDAEAGLSVVMVADVNGNPTQRVVFAQANVFTNEDNGKYEYDLAASGYAPGTYVLSIYGDAFPSSQGRFEILH